MACMDSMKSMGAAHGRPDVRHGTPTGELASERQKPPQPVYYYLQRVAVVCGHSPSKGDLMEYVLCFLLGIFIGALFQAANEKNR